MPKAPLTIGWILGALGLGFGISTIITLVMKSSMKSVRKKHEAADYVRRDSVNIYRHEDIFLYNRVTRVAKPKDDGGTRGGGFHGGGGSSIHVGSSGTSHGGSGGHF